MFFHTTTNAHSIAYSLYNTLPLNTLVWWMISIIQRWVCQDWKMSH